MTHFPLPWGRWTGLVVLLFLEVSIVALRLNDVDALGRRYALLRLCMASVTALLLFCGERLARELEEMTDRSDTYVPWWRWYVGHLVAASVSVALLVPLLERSLPPAIPPAAGRALLALSATAALVCWCRAVMPVRLWLGLLRGRKAPLLASLAVGVTAYIASRFTAPFWESYRLGLPWVATKFLTITGARFQQYLGRPPELVSPRFAVRVDDVAAGFECFGLLWVFLGAFIWVHRRQLRLPQALLLVSLTMTVMWLTSALQVAFFFVIGAYFSPDLSTRLFHSHAGAILFNLVILGMFALTRRRMLTEKPMVTVHDARHQLVRIA